MRGHVAGQKIVERFGDRLRIHAFERDLDPVHLDVERIACWNDPVFYFDHAANLRNRVSHFRRQRAQKFFVVGIEFDLDRLRHAGQVADQVLHQLQKFDLKTGNMFLDFITDIVHDFFNPATRKRF